MGSPAEVGTIPFEAKHSSSDASRYHIFQLTLYTFSSRENKVRRGVYLLKWRLIDLDSMKKKIIKMRRRYFEG